MALAPSIIINMPGYPYQNFPSLASIAALRAIPSATLVSGDNYAVDGNLTAGDGGGGVYAWNVASVAADNGSSIIKPTDKSPGQAGRWVMMGDAKAQVDTLRSELAEADGPDLVGFSNASTYADGTTGASLKARGAVVTDAPFNADATGTANSAAAFTAAAAASPYVRVPAGTYRIESVPTWTGSVYWDIDPEAEFTGAGTGVGKFPYMISNPAQLAVGPYVRSKSYQKSAHANGGIAAFQVEMEQPGDYGAGQSVAFYAGNISGNPNAGGNNWAINCLTYAQTGAGGIFQSIEADANNDSATATVKGIAISGAGTHDAAVGLEIVRLSQKWEIGAYIANAGDGLVIRPVTGGRGVVVGAVGSDPAAVGDTAVSARQMLNNADTLLLQRLTDTAPTGQFIRAVNAANSANIFVVDIAGNITGRSLNVSDRVTMNTATLSGYASLNFANDAAAAGGGVPLGGIYHNAGALRVRIA